jgi:ABC-2 type transport system permease protein
MELKRRRDKMRKLNVLGSFKRKSFKYGSYSAAISIIFIAVLIAANLAAAKLNLRLDLTENKMFTLSDETNKILQELQQEVRIYALYEAGLEEPRIVEILNEYGARSKKVLVEYKDPVIYAQFIKKYVKNGEELKKGSLIVESGSRFRIIDPSRFVNRLKLQDGSSIPESLAVEQRVTGAIMYVVSDRTPVVYNLRGHDEGELSDEVKNALENENFTLTDLNLLTDKWEPLTGDILLMVSPKRDIDIEEEQALRDFLGKGGRGVFLADLLTGEMPNFQNLLRAYGVGLKKAITVEGDPQYSYDARNPLYLVPRMNRHLIVDSLAENRLKVIIPGAQPIEILDMKRQSLMIEPLLTTSNRSWGKVDLQSNTLDREAGDFVGPFDVAVAVLDRVNLENTTENARIVVISNSKFLENDLLAQSRRANLDLFMNSLNWVQDKKQNLYIQPKNLLTQSLWISEAQKLIYSGLVVVVIPLIIAGFGFTMWVRRRHL